MEKTSKQKRPEQVVNRTPKVRQKNLTFGGQYFVQVFYVS